METFSFFIPNGVIAELGLVHDGQTVSREVRLCDLLADGQINVNDYHMLARAGVVVLPVNVFTFVEVEETLQGWKCHFDWLPNTSYLNVLFPGGVLQPLENGKELQLWLPEPPPKGFFYRAMRVRTRDVLRHKGYCLLGSTRTYSFSEGTVTLDSENLNSEWVQMDLFRELDRHCSRSYLAQGGRYELSLDYLKRDYK